RRGARVALPLWRLSGAANGQARRRRAHPRPRADPAVQPALVGRERRRPGARRLPLQRGSLVTTPSPGVIYTYSPEQQAFIAPGRASLPIGAAGWTPPSTILVGSLPVGDAHYGVPDSGQVLFVSPSGSDSAAGTIGAPKKTLAGAHAAASTTFGRPAIVLREG